MGHLCLLVCAIYSKYTVLSRFISFLYICANPFIYAIKFDPVKRVLVYLIPCKKSQEAVGSVQTGTS